ncbi:hypothetical protein Tco_0906120 [Tanacetum coccineum]
MEISIADQIALDDALVAPADRLKIGKCNLRLNSDVTSKEATLQVVYDVLKLTPFYKAFQVTADVPEIYMQEFWATAYVHNRSVRFKMNNKKHILNLDQFRDILQICPKVGNKKFEEPPLEKEILAFLASLDHFAAIINKCLSGKTSYDSLRISQGRHVIPFHHFINNDLEYLRGGESSRKYSTSVMKTKAADYGHIKWIEDLVPNLMWSQVIVNYDKFALWGISHWGKKRRQFHAFAAIRESARDVYSKRRIIAIIPTSTRNSKSYKEYYAIASGKIPPKTKGSKKKADTDATTKQKPPTVPKEKKEKKSGKGKQKAKELEPISEAVLTEAEQLKIITKRSRKETHSSHASGSGADEGTGVTPGVPDAPDYDSDDDISWKSSDDDQDDDKLDDDEKTQDDEDEDKNDDNETAQDDEDDDIHDDDENAQDDDDEAQTESEDDVHTPSRISSSDDEDSDDNEVEGMDVEGTNSDEDTTYVEDQGNEAVEDTNANLEGRNDVMTDVILPQVQATQQIEDTHVTLTPVNPDGPQQSSSVSSGFVSNMLNPNQDTGVDTIFGQQAEATSLTDIPVTTIVEPSFFALTNRPPTPNPPSHSFITPPS